MSGTNKTDDVLLLGGLHSFGVEMKTETAYATVAPERALDEYDPEAMGVALTGVLVDGTIYYFEKDELDRLFSLLGRLEVVVGVNDYVIDSLKPYGDIPPSTEFVGVQTVVSDAVGERVSLNNIASATLGRERDDPRRLPLEWQEGRRSAVKRSLKKDLLILRDLWGAVESGEVWVTDPDTLEERHIKI